MNFREALSTSFKLTPLVFAWWPAHPPVSKMECPQAHAKRHLMKHARDERVAGSKFSMRTKKKPATENFERGLEKFFAAIFAAQL
jgi:hypothetical protein